MIERIRSRLSRRPLLLRVIAWNALALVAISAVAVAASETYLRLTWPFAPGPVQVDSVTRRHEPHAEVRYTDTYEYWAVSRVNSLGFLERELPTPERAASSCHVAMVGDSFVEAREVDLADKFQVRLERMATRRLPELDVTTSAWGLFNLGQVQQLLWWDEIARLSPKLVVLVFVMNDWLDNERVDGHFPSVRRTSDGSMELAPPGPSLIPLPREPNRPIASAFPRYTRGYLLARSTPWEWLRRKLASRPRPPADSSLGVHAGLPAGGLSKDQLDFTSFALDEWRERSRRAGASLVVLKYRMGEARTAELLRVAGDIPVVQIDDYIRRQGGAVQDSRYTNDMHWTPQGHQWAAEALLEWLSANRWVCGKSIE